jgi:hypothetical protein
LKKDGSADWTRRRFASHDCLAKDKSNRVMSKRAKQMKRCGPRLVIDGAEIQPTLPELVKKLKALGHDARILREKKGTK